MIQDFTPSDFWWKNITGASAMTNDAVNAITEGYSLILGVPGHVPWPDTMRRIIRENISSGDIYITVIDAGNECGESPGDYLLRHYDTERRYRSRLASVQDYFMGNKALGGHIFWLHNFADKAQASEWVAFCGKYPSESADTGLFIIDTDSGNIMPSGRVKAVNYDDYAESHDTMIFASFLLDAERSSTQQYSREWKQYISLLAAMLCGNNAQLAESFIRAGDFTRYEPSDILEGVCGECPEDVSVRIWSAQVQVFFPMIELARVRIIRNYKGLSDKLAFALSWLNANGQAMKQSDGKTVIDPEDLDTGGLFHLLCQSKMIKPVDEELNEYVSLLRSFRNLLAHMTPCQVNDVSDLLEYERRYADKL